MDVVYPQELPYVKEKFYRGKNSKSSSSIGLSVAYEIIKRHGGELDIESSPGQGHQGIYKATHCIRAWIYSGRKIGFEIYKSRLYFTRMYPFVHGMSDGKLKLRPDHCPTR